MKFIGAAALAGIERALSGIWHDSAGYLAVSTPPLFGNPHRLGGEILRPLFCPGRTVAAENGLKTLARDLTWIGESEAWETYP
jgi:hypothetical protein